MCVNESIDLCSGKQKKFRMRNEDILKTETDEIENSINLKFVDETDW